MVKRKFFTKKKIIAGVVLLVAAALVVPSLLRSGNKTPPLVSVKEAAPAEIRSVLSTTGTIASGQTDTYIAPMGSVKVDKVNVKVGDYVTAGTPLISFDSAEVERNYRQAALRYDISYYTYLETVESYEDVTEDLNEAKMDVKKLYSDIEDYDDEIARVQVEVNKNTAKLKELHEQLKNTTDEDEKLALSGEIDLLNQTLERQNQNLMELMNSLSSKEARLEQKKSARDSYKKQQITDNRQKQLDAQLKLDELALDIARQNYKAATAGIAAKADGVITQLTAVENTYVSEGQQLAVLSSKNPVSALVALSRYDLERIELGQKATVKLLNKEYAAVVEKISEYAEPSSTGTSSVHAELLLTNPDEHIRLGLEANVSIITAEKKGVLSIPVETVSTDKEGRFCYIAEDGIVVKRYITTGVSSDLLIEVVSGLKQGDLVLYNPPEHIVPGMEVTTTFEDISTLGGGYLMMGV